MTKSTVPPRWQLPILIAVVVTAIAFVWYFSTPEPLPTAGKPTAPDAATPTWLNPQEPPPVSGVLHKYVNVWTKFPEALKQADVTATGYSNIAPSDYIHPDACAKCHPQQHTQWKAHPHAKMNATANPSTVKGKFDGSQLEYQGGNITMTRKDDQFFIRTVRGKINRQYRVTRVIGSRYQQFYVGVLSEGPMPASFEPDNLEELLPQSNEFVLPVGYWLTRDKWIPAYDVFLFLDDERATATHDIYDNPKPTRYYQRCSQCHTTMPEGYRLLWADYDVEPGRKQLHLALWDYLTETLPQMAEQANPKTPITETGIRELLVSIRRSYSPEKAVELGISCESCHFGGREHAASLGKTPPRFVPSSPHLAQPERQLQNLGRTATNINLICARCHSAQREYLPGGAAHKNSSEYLDAVSGSCYSQLSCVHCHDPHTATGTVWPKTPAQDDAKCVHCHQKFGAVEIRQNHTHHLVGSAGDHCMNCHMPRVNEGLEGMVRTHQISSPTKLGIIEGGGVNACNACHLNKPLAWTLAQLENWYDAKFDKTLVSAKHGGLLKPAAEAYLANPDPHVRLAAIGAIRQQKATDLLPLLMGELDSPLLIHRQFAQDALEEGRKTSLEEAAGYHFWMTKPERQGALVKLRELLANPPKNK